VRYSVRKGHKKYEIQDLIKLVNLTFQLEEDQVITHHKKESSPSSKHIHLVTQWYHEENIDRRKELVTVLHMNLLNEEISKIYFLQPKNKECTLWKDVQIVVQFPLNILQQKAVVYYMNETNADRLTIEEALVFSNVLVNTGYVIVTNLDIFFDHSLILLRKLFYIDPNTVYYLSRYEIDPDISLLGCQCSDSSYVGSHDALIFIPPLPKSVTKELPFEVGTWNIEVKIIYELMQANYTIRNVCKSIRAWHLHSSQVRNRLMPSKKYISDKLLPLVLRRPEFLFNAASFHSEFPLYILFFTTIHFVFKTKYS